MSKGFEGRSAGNTEKVGEVDMELTESCGDSQFIILILQTFHFKVHSEGSCFISFYFSDQLTPERGVVV